MSVAEKLERLAEAGIQLVPVEDLPSHFVLERDGFVALVERRADDFGSIGSAGILTPYGLAVLFWRDDRPFFVAKGFEQAATEEDVARLRSFSSTLQYALR